MQKNSIVLVEWSPDNEKSSGRAIHIGRYGGEELLENRLLLYGISIDVHDPLKDCRLHGYSLHSSLLKGEPVGVSKTTARIILIAEIDKALDILYSEETIKEADEYDTFVKGMFNDGAMEISRE